MIKFLIGFDAAAGQSRDQSLLHYRDRHAPLVSSIPEFWRHVAGYVQNYAVGAGDGLPAALPSDLDGVSELWFDGWERYDTAFAEPLYLEHIRPDEQRFAGFASLRVVFASDVPIFGATQTPPYKLLRFIERADGLSADGFRMRWETRHAAAVVADPAVRRFASGYVQNRPLHRAELAFQPSSTIDGVDEYGFENIADLAAFVAAEREDGADRTGGIARAVTQICTRTRVVA